MTAFADRSLGDELSLAYSPAAAMRARAVRVVAANALNGPDAALLFDMLGLSAAEAVTS